MTEENKEVKLTDKQQTFVQEYLIDLNATQAAIRAGYSEDSAKAIGYENLTKPYVLEAVQEAMAERAQRTEITQDYVLDTIVDTVERCRQARPVLDKKGDPVFVENEKGEIVPAFVFDAGNALRGSELLGKHLKLFTDKSEVETNFNINIGDKDAGTV